MAEITVYPATLRWAVKTSNADPAAVAAKRGLADFPEWLSSSEPLRLSFSKLSDIGKALQMPLAVLCVPPFLSSMRMSWFSTAPLRITESSRVEICET